MAGNVWQWCKDWYTSDYYAHSPGTDPPGPDTGDARVLRNGSWFCGADICRAVCRIGVGDQPDCWGRESRCSTTPLAEAAGPRPREHESTVVDPSRTAEMPEVQSDVRPGVRLYPRADSPGSQEAQSLAGSPGGAYALAPGTGRA